MVKQSGRSGISSHLDVSRYWRATALLLATLLALGNLLAIPFPAAAISATLAISHFRVTTNDEFVELHNVSNTSIDLNGYRVVYRSLAGTTDVALVDWTTSTVIPAGGYYLIAASPGYTGSATADITYSHGGPGLLDGSSGGVAIRKGAANTGTIVDSVGYGSASNAFVESSNAGSSGSTRQRKPSAATGAAGCVDTDNNFNDFEAPSLITSPYNSATTPALCYSSSVSLAAIGSASPAAVSPGGTTLLTVTVTPGTNPTSTGLTVTGDLTAIGGVASQQFYDDGTNGGDATSGDNIFSFSATVDGATAGGSKSLPIAVADAELRSSSASITLTVIGQRTAIHDIQGASHTSPLKGQTLTNIQGIVTAVRSNGFYLQERDADSDADSATSEAILVFTGTAPGVGVGDALIVGGTVVEFRPGGSGGTNNLTTTEISTPGRFVTVVSSGNALPAATVIGGGGRIPPTTVIDDDATGDVETSGTFDPATDGIDFYESLEGMRVQVNNAIAIGPTNSFGELPVLADNGGNGASTRTARGGIVIQAGDFNPERIILDDALIGNANMPKVNVGTAFPGAIRGVLDYDFGNVKFLVTGSMPTPDTTNAVTKETTTLTVGTNQFTVATFNVENLRPSDGAAKFNALAAIIVNNLLAPDIIAVEEVQDNNGATNDPTVSATTTYNTLIAAIQATNGGTGPTYQFRQIDPVDDQDGGEPGGNIRVGFLFRTDRGVSFVDRAGGTSTAAVSVVGGANGPQLSASPGRIDPTNAAFTSSRKPLAGEFMFNGRKIFVIANHFNSKGGDQPLFGHLQPPTRSSEVQRAQQATIVRAFVDSLLAADANANVVVLGDLNDFQFSDTLGILKGSGATQLRVLLETLPVAERYSYVFEGNSQALDHILVSPNLFAALAGYDVAHVNAEFSPQDSDHDPQLARFTLTPQVPVATSFGVTVTEDTPQALTLQGTAGNGGALTYTIVTGPTNGTLGTVSGNQVTYTPTGNYNGPDSFTFKVTESGTASNTATVSITVAATNDAPVATDDSVATNEDTPKAITLPATDTEGDTLAYTIVVAPIHGTLGAVVGNQVTYTPNGNYFGPDSFTFKSNDGNSDSNIATLALTVASVNDAPVASPGSAGTGEDTSVEITLVATDVESSPLTFSIVTPPAHGTLGAVNGTKIRYTPAPNYTGPDSFAFKANDGSADSNTATISLTVGATNDPPLAGNGAATAQANTPIAIALTGLDPENDPLTYSVVTPPVHGTLGAIVGNQVTYTPTAGYSGPDTFTFKANDGGSASNVATISITVLAPPPQPTFALTAASIGNGAVSPGSGSRTAGSTVTLQATANGGAIFIGWTVDDAFAGFLNPLTLTMNANHRAVATFATAPVFSDSANSPYQRAITTLAAYGAILGYTPEACQRAGLGSPCFGPNDRVSRAQMAALIARAMGWGAEDHGNPFNDRGGLDANLWRNVGTLAFYGVAYGYGGGAFGPNDEVSYLQSISFITRAMVAKGYWVRAQADDATIAPNISATSAHRLDLVTFVQHAGTLPTFPNSASQASWQQPATRGWYAAALLQALNSRFATTP